ncbi:MAG: hypothetical protein ACFCVD_23435 [Nodosilinea sp.]
MSNTVQEKVKADWQKAQKEGGQRAERIRQIVKAAASEALSELKGGSTEIESMGRQTLADMIAQLKAKEAAEADVIVTEQTVVDADMAVEGTAPAVTEAEEGEPATTAPTWQQIFADLLHFANDRKADWAEQVLAGLQAQVERFDADMAKEYTDRYRPFQPVVQGLRSLINLAYRQIAKTSTPDVAEPVQIEVLDDSQPSV